MKKPVFFLSFSQRLSGSLLISAVLLAGCSHDTADAVVPNATSTTDATTAVGCPATLKRVPGYPQMKCGCYTVRGLGANKQAYKNAGAGPMFMASAMLETQDMNALGYANGDYKTGDSYNAGATKQNWGMIRQVMPEYRNYKNTDYRSAGKLNIDRAYDVKVYYASRDYFGYDKFFAGHRWGEKGWRNPGALTAQEKDSYKRLAAGYQWTLDYLNSNSEYQRNDVRFAVGIEAVRPSGPVEDVMMNQSEVDVLDSQP